jgi:hypothetical protein
MAVTVAVTATTTVTAAAAAAAAAVVSVWGEAESARAADFTPRFVIVAPTLTDP